MTEYALAYPWLAFFIAGWALFLLFQALRIPFRAWNRYLRSRNIRAHGWPPSHLDADGDYIPLRRRLGTDDAGDE